MSTFELYTYTKTVADAFLPHCFIKRKQAEQYELDKVEAQKENSICFFKWIMQKITQVEHKMKYNQPIGI